MTFRSKLTLEVQRTPAPTPRVSKRRNGGAVAFTSESDLAAGLAHRGQVAERRLLTGEVLRSALGEPSRSCRSYSTAASMWDGRARASPGV